MIVIFDLFREHLLFLVYLGNYLHQQNCYTDNETNVQTINGSLVIATVRENYLNKDFTSAMIQTINSFNFARIEIRAALPKGKMLRPVITLIPELSPTLNGWIDAFSYNQTKQLWNEISFFKNSKTTQITNDMKTDEELNQFNVYVVERTDSQINFILNEKILNTFNYNKEIVYDYNPFNKQFKIRFHLGVGGEENNEFFPGQTLLRNDVDNWNCSLFIIDYIRVFEESTEVSSKETYPEPSNVTSSQICREIMPTIKKKIEMQLTFSDEFNDNVFDLNKWKVFTEDEKCIKNSHVF